MTNPRTASAGRATSAGPAGSKAPSLRAIPSCDLDPEGHLGNRGRRTAVCGGGLQPLVGRGRRAMAARRGSARLGTGHEPDRVRPGPSPITAGPVPRRRMGRHPARLGRRGRCRPASVPSLCRRCGTARPRRPPGLAAHQPPPLVGAPRAVENITSTSAAYHCPSTAGSPPAPSTAASPASTATDRPRKHPSARSGTSPAPAHHGRTPPDAGGDADWRSPASRGQCRTNWSARRRA